MKVRIILLSILTTILFSCSKNVNADKSFIVVKADSKTQEYLKTADTSFRDKYWDDEEGSIAYVEANSGKCEGNKFTKTELNNNFDKINFEGMDILTLTKNDDYDTILLYIHGGGFMTGIDPVHLQYVDKLVDNCNIKAYMPLYKLIPDYNYKDTYPTLINFYKELLKENKKIIIAGDSAGGNISMVLCQLINDEGLKQADKMMLHSPGACFLLDTPEIDKKHQLEIDLPKKWCMVVGKYWGGGKDLTDRIISPLYGKLENMPKTIFFASTYEILYDSCLESYNKMKENNQDVTFVSIEGGCHVISESLKLKEGIECTDIAIKFINDQSLTN